LGERARKRAKIGDELLRRPDVVPPQYAIQMLRNYQAR